MPGFRLTILLLLLSSLLAPCEVGAQYPFGKNKIQYTPKDWKIIETEHAEIYYYPDELEIARFVASEQESIYSEYSEYFDLSFEKKIPIIIYGTHHDFKETNVIPYMVSEATGGFTEFVKGRVVLPFMGSYKNLRRILRHELVHAFMIEKLHQVMKKHRRFSFASPPLWFTEGLAEYVAHRVPDSEAEMFIRDAVTTGNFYPLDELWRIQGTYLMYKEGESALKFIALQYGDEAVRRILENWWMSDRFDVILKRTIGVDEKELSEKWVGYLKRRYYPAVLFRRSPDETGVCLSGKNSIFEVHPVSPDPSAESLSEIYFIGYDMGAINLLRLHRKANGEWSGDVFVRGEKSTSFESFPIMRSRLSMKGDTLLFVAKAGRRDAIYLYSTAEERVIEKLGFDSLRIISSPAVSPDGFRVVFSAIDDSGRSDLFIYDLGVQRLSRITNDFFEDIHPDWSPDGESIVFSSDRCDSTVYVKRAVYEIDLATREIRALTDGKFDDVYPRYLPDGTGVIFSSDRGGGYDVFVLKDGMLYRQTELLGGALDPFVLGDGGSFLASVYTKGRFKTYVFPVSYDHMETVVEQPIYTGRPRQHEGVAFEGGYRTKKYRMKLGLDFIGAAFALDPEFGYMGNGAQVFLTDILGNHQFVFLFGTATDEFDDIFRNINFAFTYVNLENRLNYALGAFHLASYFGSMYDLLRFERRYGIVGGVSYPFSKFTRLEITSVLKGMERDDDITFLGLKEGRTWIFSNFLSFTNDNILWYVGGPMNGHRVNVSVGSSIDLEGRGYESTTLMMDFRQYFNLSRRIIIAQRFVSRNAWGGDLQLFYLGGSWDVRGYRFRQFSGKRIFFSNTELRFPLMDRLLIKFPFAKIEFPTFRGSLFFDAGKVAGFIYNPGWIGSFGAGIEMNLGMLPVIRVNFCRLTDFKSVEKGTEIDFFLGYNF